MHHFSAAYLPFYGAYIYILYIHIFMCQYIYIYIFKIRYTPSMYTCNHWLLFTYQFIQHQADLRPPVQILGQRHCWWHRKWTSWLKRMVRGPVFKWIKQTHHLEVWPSPNTQKHLTSLTLSITNYCKQHSMLNVNLQLLQTSSLLSIKYHPQLTMGLKFGSQTNHRFMAPPVFRHHHDRQGTDFQSPNSASKLASSNHRITCEPNWIHPFSPWKCGFPTRVGTLPWKGSEKKKLIWDTFGGPIVFFLLGDFQYLTI